MSVDGPLKQIFEEAMREVKEDWPAWMRSREIEGSASRTLLSETKQCASGSNFQEQQGKKKD